MSGAKARLTAYTLQHDIVLETRVDGEEKEEVLKTAGTAVFWKRPRAKDLRAFDPHGDSAMTAMIDLLKAVVKLDDIEVENLDAADFEALGERVAPGSESSRQTGNSA